MGPPAAVARLPRRRRSRVPGRDYGAPSSTIGLERDEPVSPLSRARRFRRGHARLAVRQEAAWLEITQGISVARRRAESSSSGNYARFDSGAPRAPVFAGLDFGRHANPTGNLEQVTCPCRNADRVHGRLAVSHLTQRWLDTGFAPNQTRAAPRQSSGFLGEPRSWRPQAVMVGRCDETRDPRAQDVCRGSGDRVDPRDGRGVRAECPDPNFETLLPKCLNRVSVDGSRTPQRGAQVAVSDWPWTA